MRGKSELMNPKTCLRPTLLACALGVLLQAPAALAAKWPPGVASRTGIARPSKRKVKRVSSLPTCRPVTRASAASPSPKPITRAAPAAPARRIGAVGRSAFSTAVPPVLVASGAETSADAWNLPDNQFFAADVASEAAQRRLIDLISSDIVEKVAIALSSQAASRKA